MTMASLSTGGYARLRRRAFKDLPEDRAEERGEVSAGHVLRLGRYLLLREVARGGMGVVFEAEDPQLRRRVAVKILKESEDDSLHVRRLHLEAAIAAQLSHPNIVSIHEVGRIRIRPGCSTYFIVMNFVDGRTLADVLEEGTAPREELLRILEDVAGAAAYAHGKRIIHRDLKPSNVMVENGTGKVWLTDFGLARSERFRERLTRSHSVVGTPQYMSPEQVKGRVREIDARADVYALGAILYEILAGRPPFVEETTVRLFERVLKDEPSRPSRFRPGIEGELEAICLKALEKDPKRRYSNAGEFAEDLRRFREGEAIRATPITGWHRGLRWLRRHRVAVALATAIAFAAIGTSLGGLAVKRGFVAERETRERALKKLAATWSKIVERNQDLRELRVAPKEGKSRLAEAVREVDEHVARWPERPEGYYLRSRGRMYLGDLEGAENDVRIALTKHPDFRPGWTLLAFVKFEECDRIFSGSRNGLRSYWARRSALVRQAAEALSRGWEEGREKEEVERWGLPWMREDEVLVVLVEALQRWFLRERPGEARAIVESAYREYKAEEFASILGSLSEQPAERVRWFTEALVRAPGDTKALFMRGVAREALGEIEAAIEDYDRAIELREDFAEAFVNRAGARRKRGNCPGAIEDCDRALAIRSEMVEAYLNRGSAKEGVGDAAGALADYARALEIDESLPEAYNNRGVLFMDRGDVEAARGDFDRAIELAPDLATAYRNRGRLRQSLEAWADAIADWDRAVVLGAGDVMTLHRRGAAKAALRDYTGAIEDFGLAIERKNDFYPAYANRGSIRQFLGDRSGAMQDLEQALRLAPTDWSERGWVESLLASVSGERKAGK